MVLSIKNGLVLEAVIFPEEVSSADAGGAGIAGVIPEFRDSVLYLLVSGNRQEFSDAFVLHYKSFR